MRKLDLCWALLAIAGFAMGAHSEQRRYDRLRVAVEHVRTCEGDMSCDAAWLDLEDELKGRGN